MSLKVILLKSGETLIAEAKEAVVDGKTQAYIFNKPFVVSVNQPYLLSEEVKPVENSVDVALSPWIIFTADEDIPVNPDWVVTIVDPIEGLRKMYEERIQ